MRSCRAPCVAGITATNGTVLTEDYFSCAGSSVPDPHHWLGLFQVPPFRKAWIPILSAALGILAAAYHLTRMYTTNAATSLWALQDAPQPPGVHATTPLPVASDAHGSDAVDVCAARRATGDACILHPLPLCSEGDDEISGGPASCAADAAGTRACSPGPERTGMHMGPMPESSDIHPAAGGHGQSSLDLPDLGEGGGHEGVAEQRMCAADDAVETGEVEGHSMRSAHAARADTRLVAAYHLVVLACFTVDLIFTLHLWWQLVAFVLMIAPHRSLHGVLILGLLALAAARAAVVSGLRPWRTWLGTWGEVRALSCTCGLHDSHACTPIPCF